MSAMGELKFFLGLQVDQKKDDIFIHQTKYVHDILTRFKMEDCSTYQTPIPVNHKLGPDNDNDVDPTQYRAIIGSLMYLTASRPDIMFAVCLCARFQANPKESHMKVVSFKSTVDVSETSEQKKGIISWFYVLTCLC